MIHRDRLRARGSGSLGTAVLCHLPQVGRTCISATKGGVHPGEAWESFPWTLGTLSPHQRGLQSIGRPTKKVHCDPARKMFLCQSGISNVAMDGGDWLMPGNSEIWFSPFPPSIPPYVPPSFLSCSRRDLLALRGMHLRKRR